MDDFDRNHMRLMLDGFNLTGINVDLENRKKNVCDKFYRLSKSVDELSELYENYFK
jgi:hypothetical protein